MKNKVFALATIMILSVSLNTWAQSSQSVAASDNVITGQDERAIKHSYQVKAIFSDVDEEVLSITSVSKSSDINETAVYIVESQNCSALVRVQTHTLYPVVDSDVDAYDARLADIIPSSVICN